MARSASLSLCFTVLLLASCIAVIFTSESSAATKVKGDAVHGKEIYESRCFACHSVDESRVGPKHKGVFGRKAGAVKDFDYSPEVKKSKIVWNDKNLDRWLTDPEKLIKGQRMGFRVTEAADRADVIAYLKTLK